MSNLQTQEQCELCQVDTGEYDFGRDCCLARFIMHCPTKQMRTGWLERWTGQYGKERVDFVKAIVTERWKVKEATK